MAAMTGKGRSSATTILGIILVAAILILINVIFSGTLVRIDLTEGQEFTISSATKEMLGNLRDLVTITVYMSEDLPPQLSTLRRQISDTLDEYRNYGRGHVQIDFVDPTESPEIEQRLRTLGIPQIMAQTVERDQLQVVNIYLGMVVSYLDRQEVLPVVQDTYTLEYDLTSAILKVSREDEYVVGILSGPTEHDTQTNLTGLQELLARQFRVQSINLGEGDEAVPGSIDLLLVVGPAQVPDRVQYQIDQYLMRGGRMIVLVDAVRLPEGGGLQALPVESGIEDLLAHYGVRPQKALVLDRSPFCAPASFSGGFVRYTLPYPYWPKTVPELLNAEHPITKRLESLVFPWVAPLELDVPIAPGDPLERIEELTAAEREARKEMARRMGLDVPPEEEAGTPAGAERDPAADQEQAAGADEPGTEAGGSETTADRASGPPVVATVLARSSPRSWSVSGRYDLNPQQNFLPGETKAQILAVALSGRFTSYYQGREIPPVPSAAISGDDEKPTPIEPEPTETPIFESPDTRMLVVGNAQFATDGFLGQFPENSLFLQNAVDWMTVGDQLISIRSRGATDRPLKPISDATKSTIKLLCILGAPLLVIAFGLIRFTVRRRSSSAQEVAVREI
ncbi:MAG: GldG family protein [Candidatus Eisenbacteria sp.]|nr:GldG family protein [Candidatus Eisenbacteria bacterium]